MSAIKKAVSMILSLLIVAGLFASVSAAAGALETGSNGSFRYKALEDNTIEITEYTGQYYSALAIPDTINGHTVSSIGEAAFCNYSFLESVTLGEGVKTIDDYAFCNCDSLMSINFPNGLTSIGESAFEYCSSLKSVNFPLSLTKLELRSFEFCSSLKSVTLPSGLDYIGEQVFYDCSNLKTVTVDCSPSEIGWYPFLNCDNLKTINIGSHFSNIDDLLYYGFLYIQEFPKLESIIVDENNTYVDSRNNCNAIIESATNTLILGFKNTVIPNTVVSIGESAFSCLEDIESITIPSGVKTICDNAFYGCVNLKNIYIPDTVRFIGDYAFFNCSSIESAGPVGSGCNVEFEWRKVIPSNAFYGCKNLKTIIFPEEIERIEDAAFAFCESLTSIDIPETVTYIGPEAFTCCENLSKIVIRGNPDIGGTIGAFSDCSKIETAGPLGSGCDFEFGFRSFVFPQSAFNGMEGLKSVTIPEGVAVIANDVINRCHLDELYLPKSLQGFFICPFIEPDCSVQNTYYSGSEEMTEGLEDTINEMWGGNTTLHCLNNTDEEIKPLPTVQFDCVAELEQYINVEEFKTYLAEAFSQKQYPLDISRFEIPCSKFYYDRIIDLINNYFLSEYDISKLYYADLEGIEKQQNGKMLSLFSNYYDEEAEEINEELKEITDSLLEGLKNNTKLSDLEKALLVHDRLIAYLEYDYDALYSKNSTTAHNYYGALTTGKAVCEGYSRAYQYLMNKLNIRTQLVTSDSLNHAWNLVFIDSTPYYVDCTWDDYEGASVAHENFLRSDEGFIETGHTCDPIDYAPSFSMNSTKYDNHFWKNSYTEFQLVNNNLYYIDSSSNALVKYAENPVTLKKGIESNTDLVSIGDDLFYDSNESIYNYNVKNNKSSLICKLNLSNNLYLKDLDIKDDELLCYVYDTQTKNTYLYKSIDISEFETNHVHSFNLSKTEAATCTKNGKKILVCDCGEKKVETIYKASDISVQTNCVYNGKAQKPKVTVKDSSGKTISSSNYSLKYSDSKSKAIGSYNVTVKFKNCYSGSKKLTYTIVPKATTLDKVTAKKKAAKITWKKQAVQTDGYQIQYSTSKNFKSDKKQITIKNKSTTTIKNLKAKKKYYVRIRTYKIVGGKEYCSAWSKSKTVTTK